MTMNTQPGFSSLSSARDTKPQPWSDRLWKNKDGSLKRDVYNCMMIVNNDPRITSCLGKNSTSGKVHIFERFRFSDLKYWQDPIEFKKLGRLPNGSDIEALKFALCRPVCDGGYGTSFAKTWLRMAVSSASVSTFDPNKLNVRPEEWDGVRWDLGNWTSTDAMYNLPYCYCYDPGSGIETLLGRNKQPLAKRLLLAPKEVSIVFFFEAGYDEPYRYGPYVPQEYRGFYYDDRNRPWCTPSTRKRCKSVWDDFLNGKEVRDRLDDSAPAFEFPDGYGMKALPSGNRSSGSESLAA